MSQDEIGEYQQQNNQQDDLGLLLRQRAMVQQQIYREEDQNLIPPANNAQYHYFPYRFQKGFVFDGYKESDTQGRLSNQEFSEFADRINYIAKHSIEADNASGYIQFCGYVCYIVVWMLFIGYQSQEEIFDKTWKRVLYFTLLCMGCMCSWSMIILKGLSKSMPFYRTNVDKPIEQFIQSKNQSTFRRMGIKFDYINFGPNQPHLQYQKCIRMTKNNFQV